jgi:LPXTG-motif cell wall-anchored protein
VIGFLVLLLIVWLALSVIGFVVKGLVWLAIIGLILFVGTAAIGFVRRKSVGR